jgi:hypothetical protein
VEIAKRGRAAIAVCSTAFTTLGRAQAAALDHAGLPIAVIPHPFGNRSAQEIAEIAQHCVRDLARLCREGAGSES